MAAARKAPPNRSADQQAVTRAVGGEIANLRRAQALTSAELARRAGISSAMLSRIEAGAAAPSLSTLTEVARALGIPVARLFATHDRQRDCSFVRSGQGLKVDRHGSRSGHAYELLGHSLTGSIFVEPYLVTLDDAAEPHASFQHSGIEFLHVVSGRMSYRFQNEIYDLAPGDSLLFDANAIHGPDALVERPVVYLSVVINTRT